MPGSMIQYRQYIGGQWVVGAATERIAVHDPYTGEQIGEVPAALAADADTAVRAAQAAWPGWRATPLSERLAVLRYFADAIEEHAEELARLVTAEVGTPVSLSRTTQVGYPVRVLHALCDAAEDLEWVRRSGATLVVREPAGVVAAITPWNYPLQQAMAKVGAALAAGCTVVLKPSEVAPLALLRVAELADEAGLPAGVLNVVVGVGAEVGAALVEHPGVDVVSFTGSTDVGRRIGAAAAAGVKRVALELGGKSPCIVLPGADVATAVAAVAARCFGNSGQTCAALTRLVVHRDDLAEAEKAAVAAVDALVVGDPNDPATTIGPLVSQAQRARVEGLIGTAVREGARLLVGGPGAAVPAQGHFVAPTVFSDVTSEMTVAREEIFGPVLCIQAYDTVDEAVEIANSTRYGLASAVWARTPAEAAPVAARIRAGLVAVNGGRLNLAAPLGGYKQSGNGREFGTEGILEFLETKQVNFPAEHEPVDTPWSPA